MNDNVEQAAKELLRLQAELEDLEANDPHTHHAVSVTLPETWEDRLRALWRRRVLVEGLVIRNSRCQVVRVEQVAEIHEYDSSSAVTPLSRLRGAAPEWLGGQSVDEYLRQVRSV
jgi:hypothetical protein